ncbi:tkl protein kinase [Moniliophthora roreri]|uniref:Putative kinase-like protein n=1 Tax=Moniliophthora roreri TaxID=221103 RepID=A0A0W0EUI8_MONRR|nr:tkl protein kinase [Moniliophthora roreri]
MSRTPPSSPPANSPLAHRQRYPLRRSPSSRKRAQIPTRKPSQAPHASYIHPHQDLDRGILLPLPQNTRRGSSRVSLADKLHNDTHDMLDSHINVRVGAKRKRVASGSNENTHHTGKPSRARQLKRFKSSSNTSEDDRSSMDIDSDRPLRWATRSSRRHEQVESDEDEVSESAEELGDEDQEEDDDEDNTDEYLISSAPSRVLSRLRKDELIRLYTLAGLSGDTEDCTKSELVDSIIDARDDIASLPPSSPLGRGGGYSDYSSDDAMPDDEPDEADETPRFLRRRATTDDVSRNSTNRPIKSRSLSMGNVDFCQANANGPTRFRSSRQRQKSGESNTSSRRRSSRSSPANSSSNPNSQMLHSISSPPAHHLRSRKVSVPSIPASFTFHLPTPSHSKERERSKGKAKQVEFVANGIGTGSESDLTELEELEAQLRKASPSPRRLRSKDKDKDKQRSKESLGSSSRSGSRPHSSESKKINNNNASSSTPSMPSVETLETRRITPMRKAKRKIKTLKEDDTDTSEELEDADENEDEESELLSDEEVKGQEEVEADEEEADEEEAEEEEEEEDQLATPRKAKPARTPLKRRLRPRKRVRTDEAEEDGRDGDDEEENEEDEAEGEVEMETVDEVEDEADEQEVEEEIPKRKLRNGKIVGEEEQLEEDVDMDDSETIGEEDEDDEEEEEEEDGVAEEAEEDIDAEGETDEEAMEEVDDSDVDLTLATAKTLVRLRRDDLVRLCESRELEAVGTKPQLAEALLQWRDRQQCSSPSSTGTARPPSTATVKRRNTRRKQSQDTATPPVLLRNGRVHLDEPRTPSISEQEKIVGNAVNNNTEAELELDLEELGLDDREIPPEKLQKLEKIGSGGFKDVYIGKFKGRKIAISEFRGQLSAMDIKELKLLGGFDHPNIVRFLGVSIPENTRETPVMIVSELCTNGDLFDYIRNVNPPTLHKVLAIMLDIARGLEYLHTRKPSVIHRDCKSSNILITSKGNAKIADFGLAKVKQSTRSMVRSLVGTVNWQAPELWHAHPKYNHKVDVFSCACVYWEMLQWHLPNKKYPWEGMNEHAIYEVVGTKKQRPSLTGLKKQWCPEIVDLIEHMWAQDHQERPTMSEVVERLEELVKIY